MNRRLLIATIVLGVVFVGSIVAYIVVANLTSLEETPGPGQLFDTDHDGLTDAQEEQLGTDRLEDDSDFDGLTDAEEVQIYGTNPLNADTDGDGFIDGVEVSGGFDPLAPPNR